MPCIHAPTLTIQNLSLAFGGERLFEKLSLTIPGGRWAALLGPSGVGKSSLLRCIAHLNRDAGAATTISTDLPGSVQTQIAYMAQTDLLLPWLNALDNAILPLKLHRYSSAERLAYRQAALTLFRAVKLETALHLYPHQLSGGMRQRVALIRTILTNKPIVLMDEPFSALDAITRYELQNLAAELLKNKTVLFITHDPVEALRLAHDIYVLRGRPARLTAVTQLTTATPRALTDPTLVALQQTLFTELAAEVNS